MLNEIGMQDTDFCLPKAITYILSNDYTQVRYLITANSKYAIFNWNDQSHALIEQGYISDLRDENGNAMLPSNMQNPDAITSVILPEYKDTNYYRNYIFMSQGNLFSTLQYNPAISSLRPYLVSPLTNIAEHFRTIISLLYSSC